MHKVLIICFANWDGLAEIPAIIHGSNCATIDVYCSKKSWLLKNNYYNKWYKSPDDLSTYYQHFIEFIQLHGSEYDWIIPGDDIIIRILNNNIQDENLFYKLLPISKIENRALLGLKSGFSEMCTKYGIKTPTDIVCNNNVDIDWVHKKIGFPLVIKENESQSGNGVHFCLDESSFIPTLQNITNKENLVIQKYIPGHVIKVDALYKNGVLLMYNYSNCIKMLYSAFGVSTIRSFYHNESIKKVLSHMGTKIGLNGFTNITFLYSIEEQEHYLIEIDVRPNAWLFYGKLTGNDFSIAVNKYLNNDLTFTQNTKAASTTIIRLFSRDLTRILLTKDYKDLIKWIINYDNCWKYIPFYDKVLLKKTFQHLRHIYSSAVKNKVKNVFRSLIFA